MWGKKGGDHTLPQGDINQLIIDRAQAGKNVVRLKGGDPFIFGRGGEEAEELVKAGIPFEVVPGITSAIAVPAYAGIPLTHRRYNSSVAFITGHEDPHKDQTGLDWEKLATGVETLVFLMGYKNLPRIVERLIQNGRPPQTPTALIRWGTTPEQVTVTGSLTDIVRLAEAAGLGPPAILVVGSVVELREQLSWFERRPLFGKQIVVTRTREQASDLVLRLENLGADCLEFPTIRLAPPSSWEGLDQAINSLASFDWLLFTSPNGVGAFFNRLMALGFDLRDLKGPQIGAIGPATAGALKEWKLRADLVPEKFQAEYILEALAPLGMAGKKSPDPPGRTSPGSPARRAAGDGRPGGGGRRLSNPARRFGKGSPLGETPGRDRSLPDLYQFLHRPQFFGPLRPAGNPAPSDERHHCLYRTDYRADGPGKRINGPDRSRILYHSGLGGGHRAFYQSPNQKQGIYKHKSRQISAPLLIVRAQ